MKKWNRLMALVLAGAMTLLMLTGCCVGTETETDPMGEKLIEETFKAYNSYRAEDDQLSNDETLPQAAVVAVALSKGAFWRGGEVCRRDYYNRAHGQNS